MPIYHKHHITPKHMGGSNDPSNLVTVTIQEHANLHKQLWEELGNEEDRIAWMCLSGQISNSEATIMAIKNANTGRKVFFSEQHRKNLKESRKRQKPPTLGMKFKEEHTKKILMSLHKEIICECCNRKFNGKSNYNRHIQYMKKENI
jgi:hypothetical protein